MHELAVSQGCLGLWIDSMTEWRWRAVGPAAGFPNLHTLLTGNPICIQTYPLLLFPRSAASISDAQTHS